VKTEDLIASDLVDSCVQREGGHNTVAAQKMVKAFWFRHETRIELGSKGSLNREFSKAVANTKSDN
jgi:hypothetical protein